LVDNFFLSNCCIGFGLFLEVRKINISLEFEPKQVKKKLMASVWPFQMTGKTQNWLHKKKTLQDMENNPIILQVPKHRKLKRSMRT
jgi:hypothetical protein